MQKELELRERIEQALRDEGIPFEVEVDIDGLRPDFLIRGPNNRIIVVDAKAWENKPGFTSHASRQAELIQTAPSVDGAVVVLEDLKRNMPSKRVVNINGLIDAISEEFDKPARPKRREQFTKGERTIFAAMPFAPEYEDVFYIAMTHAAKSIGGVCIRIDHEDFVGDIVSEVKRSIRNSYAVIADLSESRPNVLYEVGYAHALRKPTVHICSTPLSGLPFDVRNIKTTEYHKGQVHALKGRLVRNLKAILNKKSR